MKLIKWGSSAAPSLSILNEIDRFFTFRDNNYENRIFNGSNYFHDNTLVNETDKQYKIFLDVPGIDKKDIKIEISKNILTISGQRKDLAKIKEKDINDSNEIAFNRRFKLNQEVLKNDIVAKLKNGVLSLLINKTIPDKPKVLNIPIS
tara:strand:+ start:2910 stop:3353 length:444 start_codon:yes stop_codon:yes gene_type:complete